MLLSFLKLGHIRGELAIKASWQRLRAESLGHGARNMDASRADVLHRTKIELGRLGARCDTGV